MRLVDGPGPSAGRVEVYYSGEWGTVCDDAFDNADARVVCRMLGYHDGLDFSNRYGAGSGRIWLDEVQCTGTEASIADCRHRGWGVVHSWFRHNCGHSEDVSVSCIAVRLVGGPSALEGRLEVLYWGSWGTVCDRGFDDADARAVCRMHGYWDGLGQFIGNLYGAGSGTIWLQYVRCNGTETSIADCGHHSWGSYSYRCDHRDDV